MSSGPDLFAGSRPNDLPPRWDGYAVEWQGWTNPAPIFLCGSRRPRRPDPCARCGSTAPQVVNRGVVTTDLAGVTVIGRARLDTRRHVVTNLYAYRCTDCRHDQVLDSLTDGNWWDLDPDDYLDTGSTAP